MNGPDGIHCAVHPLGLNALVPEAATSPDALTRAALPTWSLYNSWQRCGFLAVLFLVTTSSYFDYFVLSVVVDPIKQEFGVSDSMLGLLGGLCFTLFYVMAALPIARWADHGNRRTVMTIALTAWSVMTMVCGLAQTFWQLVIARLGVGAVEPGAVPPAQSLIVDYFPPERRALAISTLTSGGSAAGYLLGVGLGGYIAATRGWRMAFFLAGAPGLVLAVVVRLVLSEPRQRSGFPIAGMQEGVGQALQSLRRKRSYIFALAGLSVYGIYAYGTGLFLPSFMIRSLHSTLVQVSETWGFTISAADLLGAVGGGWLTDRLGQRDVRWYAWLPATGCLLSAPVYGLSLAAHNLSTFIALNFMAELMLFVGLAGVFVAMHAVCGATRRVMAIAIAQLALMLVGSGIGPSAAGLLSDLLRPAFGLESLRYALISMLLFLLPAALAFYCCGRAMQRELEG